MDEEGNNSGDENIKSHPSQQNEPNVVQDGTYPYKTSSEFAAALNNWLWHCYNWQCMTLSFPYFTALSTNNASNSTNTPDLNRNFPNALFPNQNYFAQQAQPSAGWNSGQEYVIPSLWKRFAAEVIDFFILLTIKVMITYIAVDFFDLINVDKYDLDLLKNDKLDYKKAMELTSEIIVLEVIHRFIVCLFEALCLHRGLAGAGGATPGKCIMKLRVVCCHSIVPVSDNRIRVYPASDLGFGWALLRSFIKNFSLAFIFPICFTMFFFQHNRTAYDIICNSIVVEDPTQIPVRF